MYVMLREKINKKHEYKNLTQKTFKKTVQRNVNIGDLLS